MTIGGTNHWGITHPLTNKLRQTTRCRWIRGTERHLFYISFYISRPISVRKSGYPRPPGKSGQNRTQPASHTSCLNESRPAVGLNAIFRWRLASNTAAGKVLYETATKAFEVIEFPIRGSGSASKHRNAAQYLPRAAHGCWAVWPKN
jgi:hypothetical protein